MKKGTRDGWPGHASRTKSAANLTNRVSQLLLARPICKRACYPVQAQAPKRLAPATAHQRTHTRTPAHQAHTSTGRAGPCRRPGSSCDSVARHRRRVCLSTTLTPDRPSDVRPRARDLPGASVATAGSLAGSVAGPRWPQATAQGSPRRVISGARRAKRCIWPPSREQRPARALRCARKEGAGGRGGGEGWGRRTEGTATWEAHRFARVCVEGRTRGGSVSRRAWRSAEDIGKRGASETAARQAK